MTADHDRPAAATGPARAAEPAARPMRSLVLETSVDLVLHAVLATSLFFLFSGHNAPGGGFIGGLVAGTAFVLRYLVSSGEDVLALVRVRPSTVLGAGLLTCLLAAVTPWLLGGQVLESAYTYLHLPLLGELPLASVLVFDTGVYLVVVGTVLVLLSTLGAQTDAFLGAEMPDAGPAGDPEAGR